MIINCVTLHLDDWKSKSQLLHMLLKNGFNFYKEIVPNQDLSFSFRLRKSGSNVSNMRNPVSLVWLVLSESS